MKRWTMALVVLFGLSCGMFLPAADFNGDGTNDVGIFRAASGLWAIRGITRVYFGTTGDEPLPGDYNGDGETEIAVFRVNNALWAIRGLTRIYFGGSGDSALIGVGGGSPWRRDGSTTYYTAGKVGIGINNPAWKFHIKDNWHGGWIMGIHNTGLVGNDYGLVVRADGGDPLWVQTYNGDTALRVEQDGDVGIGVNDPAYDLDVAGNIRATGSVYYGGTAGVADGTPYTRPDYVCKKGYNALSIEEVEEYLGREEHLPWLTAAEDEEGGVINMTRMTFETVETAENLQLQIISLSKLVHKQHSEIEAQNERLKLLEAKLVLLEEVGK